MSGSLSQSYFIFDAQQYKVGRKIYFGMDVGADSKSELELEVGPSASIDRSDDLSMLASRRSKVSKKSGKRIAPE